MKTTLLKKLKENWLLITTAASHMWRWFTAAPEELNSGYHFEAEPENKKMLFEQNEIKGTPFKVVGNHEKGYWIALGPYRLTMAQKTKGEALGDLEGEKWNIVARLVNITHEFEKRQKETDKLAKQ